MQLTEEQEFTMRMAEVGYNQYRKSARGRAGHPATSFPEWKDLDGGIKNSWFSTAAAMVGFLASQKLVKRGDK